MIKTTVITSLYRCSKYLNTYLEHAKKITNPQEIEILLLHNDPIKEELDIIEKEIENVSYIKHIIIPQREGLYATWNRGIKLAQGEYCTIWNVDDIRTPDSLKIQAEALDQNPNTAISYGNYILTQKHGDTFGSFVDETDFNIQPQEAKVSHIVGCFPMWRKSIHTQIGYFDEQFRLVADYEFQIRAAHSYPLIKVNHLLGYFLQGDGSEGRLSQKTDLQNSERTAVEIRYGIYYKMDLLFYKSAKKAYNINSVSSYGEQTTIDTFIPNYKALKCHKKKHLFIALLRLPFNLMKHLKHSI